MRVATFAPRAALADIVSTLTIVETGDVDVTRVLVPELGPIVGARYTGRSDLAGRATPLPDLVISGVQGTSRTIHTHRHSGIVLAKFRPGGAAALFGAPLHELYGDAVALDALAPRDRVEQLGERVRLAVDDRARIAALEELLLDLRHRPADPVVRAATRAIEAARGAVRISELARTLAISQDPLEKRFRRAIGATPKQFASLVRVRAAIALASKVASPMWSRIALEVGYYDQSHLIREFQSIVGEAPAMFLRSRAYG